MNKKTLWIGLGLLIVLAIPLFVIPHMEADIVRQVQTQLTSHGITTDSIEYDLLGDKLIIKNFAAKNFLLAEDSINIAEVIAISPNAEAFNINTKDIPLVAKELILNGATLSYKLDVINATMTTQSIQVFDWKQNVAKVIELKKQGFTEQFFAALFEGSTAKCVYTNHVEESHTIEDGVPFVTITKFAKSTFTDMQYNLIGQYNIENIQYVVKRNGVTAYEAELQDMHWTNILLPYPPQLAYFVDILPKINDDLPDEEAFKLMANLEATARIIANTEATFNNLIVKKYKDTEAIELFNLQSASLLTAIDDQKHSQADFDLKLSGITVATEHLGLDAVEQAIAQSLLGKSALLDASLDLNLSSQDPSNVAISFGLQDVANIVTKLDATIPAEALQKLFSFNGSAFYSLATRAFETWAKQAQFISFELDYTDESLLPKLLLLLGEQQNTSPSITWQNHAPFIKQAMAQELTHFKAQDLETIYKCLENPGTLKLKVQAKEAMGFDNALFALISNMEVMDLSIICEAGTNIVEAAKALEKKQ